MLDAFVERLTALGLRDWSIFGAERRVLSLGIRDREAGSAHTPLSIAESLGARYLLVWDDGRVSRGNLERSDLESSPDAALDRARAGAYEDPDAAYVRGTATFPETALHDAAAAAMAGGDTTSLAERLDCVRQSVERERVRTWSGSFSASSGAARLVTSRGLDVSGSGTSAGWHVTLDGEIGDGFSARAPEPFADFASRLDRLIVLAERLREGATPGNAGRRPVLLHPHVVERYALATLLHNLQGSVIANDEGHFRREQFASGDRALRDDLTLRLDPLVPLRSGSYRFTDEGVPAARFTFLERGRLLSPILGLKYARRLGLEPTPVPYSMDTLHLEASTVLDMRGALDEASGGVLVLSVLGVHTQDAASGDFSLSAPQALRIGPDGIEGRERCTISGNLFRVLRDARMRLVSFEGEHTPGLLFEGRVDPSA